MAIYDSVNNLLSDAAIELSLSPVAVTVSSTDPNIILLYQLLKSVGRGLLLEHEWMQFTKEHTFTTTGATSYTLPTDFVSYVDQTGWNRTTVAPLLPLTPQQWQAVKAFPVTGSIPVIFRPRHKTIEVPAALTSGQTIALEYRSAYWLSVTPGTADPTKAAPTLGTDFVWMDPQLVTRALKLAFLRSKGFDTTTAQGDYDDALSSVRSASAGASPVLSLSGRSAHGVRLLDDGNVPETGYGA